MDRLAFAWNSLNRLSKPFQSSQHSAPKIVKWAISNRILSVFSPEASQRIHIFNTFITILVSPRSRCRCSFAIFDINQRNWKLHRWRPQMLSQRIGAKTIKRFNAIKFLSLWWIFLISTENQSWTNFLVSIFIALIARCWLAPTLQTSIHLNTEIKKGALRLFREIQTGAVAELHVNVDFVVLLLSPLLISKRRKVEWLLSFFFSLKPIYSIKRAKRVFHFASCAVFHPMPSSNTTSAVQRWSLMCNCWIALAHNRNQSEWFTERRITLSFGCCLRNFQRFPKPANVIDAAGHAGLG